MALYSLFTLSVMDYTPIRARALARISTSSSSLLLLLTEIKRGVFIPRSAFDSFWHGTSRGFTNVATRAVQQISARHDSRVQIAKKIRVDSSRRIQYSVNLSNVRLSRMAHLYKLSFVGGEGAISLHPFGWTSRFVRAKGKPLAIPGQR